MPETLSIHRYLGLSRFYYTYYPAVDPIPALRNQEYDGRSEIRMYNVTDVNVLPNTRTVGAHSRDLYKFVGRCSSVHDRVILSLCLSSPCSLRISSSCSLLPIPYSLLPASLLISTFPVHLFPFFLRSNSRFLGLSPYSPSMSVFRSD